MVNYSSVPVSDSLLLVLEYIGISAVIVGLAWLFYRDWIKAALFAFVIMALQFYFGALQDGLKNLTSSFISQYRFLLPFIALLVILLMVWLKKRKKPLTTVTAYLNLLLIVLILIDAGRLAYKISKSGKESREERLVLKDCKDCLKPDIYLILLDQYASNMALKEVFQFDNDSFEQKLNQRGFHIAKASRSNYNLTPFSMASTLDMNYLGKEMGVKNNLNVGYSYRVIQNSTVIQFLARNGYEFYNYSVFDFPGQPARQYEAFFPYGRRLITAQTFSGRLKRDIRSAILEGKLGSREKREEIAYEHLHFNNDILDLIRKMATIKPAIPRFVYAHLMMPHFPYYYDSKGKALPLEKLSGFRHTNANDYIEYLQYCNHQVLALVDHILSNSAQPPIIMLLADHGFRHPGKNVDRKYDFMNLNAIYLPQRNYGGFYDSISNVNHFRVVLNSCFNQQLPLVKDSTVDLWE